MQLRTKMWRSLRMHINTPTVRAVTDRVIYDTGSYEPFRDPWDTGRYLDERDLIKHLRRAVQQHSGMAVQVSLCCTRVPAAFRIAVRTHLLSQHPASMIASFRRCRYRLLHSPSVFCLNSWIPKEAAIHINKLAHRRRPSSQNILQLPAKQRPGDVHLAGHAEQAIWGVRGEKLQASRHRGGFKNRTQNLH